MRIILSLLLVSILVGHSEAQSVNLMKPMGQYLIKIQAPTLAEYDSMATSNDTGAAFTALATSRQNYLGNGHIDTLTIFEFGVPTQLYFGVQSGNRTEIKGVSLINGDSISMMVAYQDAMQRDTLVEFYGYNGAFVMQFETHFTYNTNSQPTTMDIMSGTGGVGKWEWFYDGQQRLDSMFYQPVGIPDPSYSLFFYNSTVSQRLERMEYYEDVDGDGEPDLYNLTYCINNDQNKVTEFIELYYNTATQSLELTGTTRHCIKKDSDISVSEYSIAEILKTYPNPVNDQLFFDGISSGSIYEIYNLSGLKIDEGLTNGKSLDFSEYPKGMYFIQIVDDGISFKGSFIKD